MDDIIVSLKNIIEDITDIPKDEINIDSALIDDLDLSSLEALAVLSEIENHFSISIPESELVSIATIEELAKLVERKIKQD
jgi:acyl carrier protein